MLRLLEGLGPKGKETGLQAAQGQRALPAWWLGSGGVCEEEVGCVRGGVARLYLEKVRQAANEVWWKEP